MGQIGDSWVQFLKKVDIKKSTTSTLKTPKLNNWAVSDGVGWCRVGWHRASPSYTPPSMCAPGYRRDPPAIALLLAQLGLPPNT